MNQSLKAGGSEAATNKTSDDPQGIINPGPFARRDERLAHVNRARLLTGSGANMNLVAGPGGARRDNGITLERHRKNKTIVVIGVLADDVYAPGCGREPDGLPAIGPGEFFGDFAGKLLQGHRH